MTTTRHSLDGRLETTQRSALAASLDAILVTPGSDLRYLTGYHATALERLTCLVLPAEGEPTLIVPQLERPAASASPVAGLRVQIRDYPDGTSPYPLVAEALHGRAAGVAGISSRMWAEHLFALREALPGWQQRAAGPIIADLRIRKVEAEVHALRRAGAAIDTVHSRMAEWLRPGRSELQVAGDIAYGMREAGHASVEFTIVASGPNSASPHHSASNRIIEHGDVVVVDIGGAVPEGYYSDCTRTYLVGGNPDARLRQAYSALQEAQSAAVQSVRPGTPAEEIDAAARQSLQRAGYAEYFLHRTGHGIGLDPHEDPYIVPGNYETLQPGMVFSIEPGIYVAGEFGLRIEDIVLCTEGGVECLNSIPRDLVVL